MGALGRLLLAEGEAEIADVRARILSALGPNIGSLATVPELAALLDLPPVRPEAAAVSLGDWDVLTALGASTSGARATTTLAAQIGWERSPLSHHAKRMAGRGLLELQTSATDRRATQLVLTPAGRSTLEKAAPGHVEFIKRPFSAGMPDELLEPLAAAMESVYANLLKHGSLPIPD
jgi:DNA-binding MarR family transcriptional regulator